jgi:hypothetical protein
MRLLVRASVAIMVACGGGLPIPIYTQQRPDALALVPYPPPPARAEFVPNRPANDTVWIDGEWVWRRRRWAWRPGRWVVPPSGGRFSPWVMVRADDGAVYYASGAWRDAKDQEIADPQPLATGRSSAGEVVNAEGERENTGQTVRAGVRDAAADGGIGP